MADLAQAKLYTVSEPLDKPVSKLIEGETAVEIQFNPASLAVALANTLGENERDDSDKPAQFVDKSSSTLTVELIFDTTDQYFTRAIKDEQGNDTEETEEARVDVRTLTQAIANNFMKQETVGDDTQAPKKCLFAWGTFAFAGVMETFDETLEFFSPEGTPLRATVSLKISESRYQFRTEEAKAAERDTPTLGAGGGGGDVAEANTDAGKDDKDWRETAMYNGVESPRAPSADSLSVPSAGASADLKASASLDASAGIKGGFGGSIGGGAGLSAGIGGGLSAGISGGLSAGISGGISGGIGAGVSGGISGGFDAGISGGLSAGISGGIDAGISGGIGGGLSSSIDITPPSFSFGASASLGTSIPGAFSADFKSGGGISAGSIVSGGASLNGVASTSSSANFSSSASASSSFNSSGGSASASASANASIGFD